MAATQSRKSPPKGKKTSRCWPGYEPTPGKRPHEEGSCKPIPKSKSNSKAARTARSRSKSASS